jgi:MFS family permease
MGAGLALFLGGAIIHLVGRFPPLALPGFGTLHSWQMTFFVVGLLGSLVIVPMAFVKEPVRKGLLDTSGKVAAKGLPIRDVLAYMRRHWKFYLAYLVGFGLANTVSAATLSWTPSYFIRVHGWTPLEIGSFYGLTLSIVGTVSVLLGARASEWMDARGFTDTNMRLPAIVFALAVVPAILAYLMPSGGWSAAFLILAQLIGGFATAPMMAGLQLMTPNEMRGQMMAVFVLVSSVFGSGIGPLIVALFTDYVFMNDHAVGWSLIATILIVKPIVVGIFIWGLKPYREGLREANARA